MPDQSRKYRLPAHSGGRNRAFPVFLDLALLLNLHFLLGRHDFLHLRSSADLDGARLFMLRAWNEQREHAIVVFGAHRVWVYVDRKGDTAVENT